MNQKELLNLVAVVLTFFAFIPYIQSILKGKTKPHVFSWVIWGLATVVVFFAQVSDGAGVGAWSIGLSGVLTLGVAYLAYERRADHTISRVDWLFFASALSALPFWYWTHDPFWAVVILTTVDTLGFGPTFVKAYHKPREEQLGLYNLTAIRNIVAIAALENYSWTTVLFPAVISATCALFVALVIWRRHLNQ